MTVEADARRGAELEGELESKVTIVMVTRNRCEEAVTTLHRLRSGAPTPPIVVVDNDSTDGTPSAVRRAAVTGVSVLELGDNLGAAGRTFGVLLASTPYVAFSDDDSWWAPGALARAAAELDSCPRLAVVAARVSVGDEEVLDPTCRMMQDSPLPRAPDLPGPAVLGFLACGAVVRRDAYLAVGGFHEALAVGGEEELLAVDLASAGWALAYVEDVVAHHHPSPVCDRAGRRRRHAVNRLLVTWLRRPRRVALERTVAALRGDRESRRAVVDALARLPVVLRERRVLDAGMEMRLQLLEASGPDGG